MAIFNPYESERTRVPAGDVRERDPGLPWCSECDTDEFLMYEDFVPARRPAGGGHLVAASVNYSCSVCGRFNGHEVPDSWNPPNWFWYS
ncbi:MULTISPECIES: hypothetical protein [unclassified Arthrobacter]|uniref:hypothetical protein n=1 Tax=unclassified Arthrobacter TaxID=235627 RepID=UPI0003616848|nr:MULTISPECIES: hypothetical protein [unclassified Arthrobacter]